MVLLVSTQFKGLEVVCCRQLPELHRSLTPRSHPSHKKVHQGHALLSILVYIFDVCVQAVKRLLEEGVNQEVMLGSST